MHAWDFIQELLGEEAVLNTISSAPLSKVEDNVITPLSKFEDIVLFLPPRFEDVVFAPPFKFKDRRCGVCSTARIQGHCACSDAHI